MIRYTCRAQIGADQASRMELPELRRLHGRGPWQVGGVPGAITITRGTAPAWGPERPALGGLTYQLPVEASAINPRDLLPARPGSVPVILRCGVTVHLELVTSDGVAIGLDGVLGEPTGDYGRALFEAFDILEPGAPAVPWNHPVLVEACRQVLLHATRLPVELIHAYGLLSTGDVWALITGASGLPKADAGAGGTPAASPASIPAA